MRVSTLLVQPHPGTDPEVLADLDIPLALANQVLENSPLPPALAGKTPTIDANSRSPTSVTLDLRNPAAARRNARKYMLSKLYSLWLLPVVTVLAGELAAFAGRKVRIIPADHCQYCGYPMGDLPEPVCPECGRTSPFARR